MTLRRRIKFLFAKLRQRSPVRKAYIRRNRIEIMMDWARMLKYKEREDKEDKFCPHCGQNWTKQGGCPCV